MNAAGRAASFGWSRLSGQDRLRRVGLEPRPPRAMRCGVAAVRPETREPEVELDDRARPGRACASCSRRSSVPRARRERGADLRLERVVPREERRCVASSRPRTARSAARSRASQSARKPSASESGGARRRRRLAGRGVVDSPSEETTATRRPRPRRRSDSDQRDDAAASVARTIAGERDVRAPSRPRRNGSRARRYSSESNAGYRELLGRVRAEIDEISSVDAHELVGRADAPLFVDVREPDEWDEGHIPGARPRAARRLESRIEGVAPDKSRAARRLLRRRLPLGVRGEDAGRARLRERRPSRAASPTGSGTASTSTIPRVLSPEQRARYAATC